MCRARSIRRSTSICTAFEESLGDNSPQARQADDGAGCDGIVEGCGFKTLADIDAEAVQTYLRSLRRTKIIGAPDLQSLPPGDRFVLQLVRHARKRLLANPLLGLERLNTADGCAARPAGIDARRSRPAGRSATRRAA